MATRERLVRSGRRAERAPVTEGEWRDPAPAALAHALSELERSVEPESAEWNHLHEGLQLDDGRP